MSQHDEEHIKDILGKLVRRSSEERINDLEGRVEALELHRATKLELSNAKTEFHRTNLGLVKWIAATIIASASLILGVLKYLS